MTGAGPARGRRAARPRRPPSADHRQRRGEPPALAPAHAPRRAAARRSMISRRPAVGRPCARPTPRSSYLPRFDAQLRRHLVVGQVAGREPQLHRPRRLLRASRSAATEWQIQRHLLVRLAVEDGPEPRGVARRGRRSRRAARKERTADRSPSGCRAGGKPVRPACRTSSAPSGTCPLGRPGPRVLLGD